MSNSTRELQGFPLCSWTLSPLPWIAVLLLTGAPRVEASDKVWEYADSCYSRLDLSDHDDLKGPFDCRNGELLPVHVNGVKKDIGEPTAATDFPGECDYPAWLFASEEHCYGHSRIQVLPTPSNPKIKAVLLCRHKKLWSDDATAFDDIAMIVHNRSNGETCWFQTDDFEPPANYQRDGTSVPGPKTVADHEFWMTPAATASVQCITCHDSGPWVNSRWMDNAINAAAPTMKDGKGAYKNSEPPFNTWKEPTFITVARAGLDNGGQQCSRCHKIAAKDNDFRKFATCTEWIGNSVGRRYPTRHAEGLSDITSATGESVPVAFWMPVGHGHGNDAAAWKAQYDAHVDKVIECCENSGVGVVDCNTWEPRIRTAGITPTLPSVQIAASYDGGVSFDVGAQEPWEEEPIPNIVPAHTELTLSWGSPPEQEYCALEATFPDGVNVNGIRTASNFNLDDGYPQMLIGELVYEGTYRFDLICDEDGEPRAASISFLIEPTANVPGLSPWLIAPLVALLVAIVVRTSRRLPKTGP